MVAEEVDPEMVERLLREGALPVRRALAVSPPSCRGKARSPTTLIRWIEAGKRGVRLEGFYGADKTWWTSLAALGRFFARLTELRLAGRREVPASAARGEREERQAAERARTAAEARRKIGRR